MLAQCRWIQGQIRVRMTYSGRWWRPETLMRRLNNEGSSYVQDMVLKLNKYVSQGTYPHGVILPFHIHPDWRKEWLIKQDV